MRNKLKIVFVFMMVLGFCGCDGDVTRDIRHAGYTLNSEKFVCSDLMPKDDSDISYKKIKYFNNEYIITEEGDIYEISLNLKYSNDENCKKANASFQVDGLFGDVARAKDGKIYYLTTQNTASKYSAVSNSEDSYQLYNLLLSDKNNLKIQAIDSSTGSYYILKTDGNVYNYIVSRDKDNKNYVIVSSNIAYSKTEYNGDIVDFSYKKNDISSYIKTNKQVFRLRASNYEDCQKYADVECVYKMTEDDAFIKHREKILAFNGINLITTYGRTFNVQS